MGVEAGIDEKAPPAAAQKELPPLGAGAGLTDKAEAQSGMSKGTENVGPGEEKGTSQAQKEQANVEEESLAEIVLEVELPTGGVLTLPPVQASEVGLGVKQVLAEYPEACYYTSYALVVKGSDPRVEINDFTELNEYEGNR
ncbi:hypothetical protein Naga_100039g42 [Nannochloropsis gaditana]|uniref:Clustered mitochondria protein N-terminal domain-containing protein n=1 Tax=Nannochloropsis gaditana TaxID=72520 RepID=W7TMY6_9STRA|nr:hypothetical protein Naga_100039g42 [Nannochloropsis gaditana]